MKSWQVFKIKIRQVIDVWLSDSGAAERLCSRMEGHVVRVAAWGDSSPKLRIFRRGSTSWEESR